MIYSSETWLVKKYHEKRLEVAQMIILRKATGKTSDKIFMVKTSQKKK